MNQAQMKNGDWVEVEMRTDGVYANGIKVANVYYEKDPTKVNKLVIIDL